MQSCRLRLSSAWDGLAPRLALLGSLGFATFAAGTAQAVDATWVGPGGEWTTAGNWSSVTQVPDGTATFTNNGAPTAVTITNTASIDSMQFTAAAPAYSFTVNNGAAFTVNTGITTASPQLPNFQVNTGSTLTFDGTNVAIGALADGPSGGGTLVVGTSDPLAYLTIAGGTSTTFSGSISASGSLELANTATTLTLTSASNGGNIGTIGGDLTLCDCFAGGLTISGGALTVDGFGTGVVVLGGTLSVVNSGTLQDNGLLLVATTMAVSGPGSSVTASDLTGIGIFGPGALTISNGGTFNSQGGAEIDAPSGTPSATVTGGGSTWNVGGAGLVVGGGSTGGPGMLSIANGGQVNVAGIVEIGDLGPGTSFASVTGAGSTLTATGGLVIGQTSATVGTLTVADGGVVNAAGSTGIGQGSTLNLGTGGISGAIVTPAIVNEGAIVANFTDTLVLAADISDVGTLSKAGPGTLVLTGNNSYSGGTTVTGGLINFSTAANLGSGTVTLNGGGLQWAAGNTTDISSRLTALGAGGGTFDTNGNAVTLASAITGAGGLVKSGAGTLTLTGINSYQGGTAVNGGTLAVSADNNLGNAAGGLAFGGGTLRANANVTTARAVTLNGGGGTVDSNGHMVRFTSGITGGGGLTKTGAGALFLLADNNYTGGTTVNGGILHIGAEGGPAGSIVGTATVNGDDSHLAFLSTSSAGNLVITLNGGTGHFFGNSTGATATITANAASTWFIEQGGSGGQARFIVNAGGALDISPLTISGTTAGSIEGAGSVHLGSKQLTVGANNLSTTVSGAIADGGKSGGTGGSLVKVGTGTLTLTGANTYTGGTTVSGGILQGNTLSLQGNILNNAAVVFNQTTAGTYAGNMSGSGGMTLQGGGVLTITGNNLYTGPTTVTGSGLVVNGSLASTVTLDANSVIGGSGSIGGLVSNGAMLAPGNSIGTLNITGNFAQTGGVYQVETNAAGQSDRINATGTATIGGGATVQVLAQPGNYATSTTYTILSATGGVSGAYSSVSSNFAFLTPSLSYDANNVFLTLALQGNAFSGFGGNTPNQRAVGYALDQSFVNATGDFATVIGALANLNAQQGPWALNQISGQPYADFGSFNVANNALFMNALGQQMALARGGVGQRTASGAGAGLRCCRLRRSEPVLGVGQRAGRRRLDPGRRQQLDLHLQRGWRCSGHRLSPEPERPGRHRCRLHQRHAVGRQLLRQGLEQQRERCRLWFVHPVGPLRRCAGGLRLLQQPASASDLDPRPAAVDCQRQHRRQPVPRPGRDRLQDRDLCAGAGHRDTVRALPDLEHQPGGVQRMGRQLAQPQRAAADNDIDSHGAGRRSRRRHRRGQHPHLGLRAAAGLAARIRQHRTAADGGVRRCASGQLHRLRSDAAARRRRDRLPGQHQRRHRHAALSSLRRRRWLGHRQPRPQPRGPLLLVAQSRSASMRAARAAPSASTGLKPAGPASSAIMASAIASGVADPNSMRRPAP